MTISLKHIIIVVLSFVLILCGLGFIIYFQQQIISRQAAINESIVEQKQLNDHIVRSMSQYATKKDMDEFIKENNVNLNVIRQDLGKLNASVVAVNKTIVYSRAQSGTNIPSTSTDPRPDPVEPTSCSVDLYGYLKNKQNLELSEKFNETSVPIGSVSFSAWKEKPWDVSVKQRSYNMVNVIGKDEEGKQYIYNKFSVSVDGKEYPVNINNAKLIQEYPGAKFKFWNPRLYIGAGGGINIQTAKPGVNGEFTPNATFGFMTYGKYNDSPDWSFLQLGMGYDIVSKQPQVVIVPAAYNVGQHIPKVIRNTYVAPQVQVGFDGAVSVGAGIQVGL